MSPEFNPLYSPYGAYELKATYQRNMLVSSLSVFGFVTFVTVLGIIFINSPATRVPPKFERPTENRRDLPQPPTVVPSTPQVNIRPPKSEIRDLGVMVPVDDDAFIDDETEVISIEEFAEFSDDGDGQSIGENFGIGNFESDDGMFGLKEFVILQRRPEFIHRALPAYPRLERTLGIEGNVWIAVEVEIDGSVSDAKVYKTSGRESFDQAALAVAYENRFRPAIQNNNPIKIWISYEVEFVLTR